MALLRPRVARETEVRYHADQELAKCYPEKLEAARKAEHALRQAQAERADVSQLARLGAEFDRALTEALRVAQAAERAALGPRAYEDRILRRKMSAQSEVRRWTSEVERLRTLRETHRMQGMVRTARKDGMPLAG